MQSFNSGNNSGYWYRLTKSNNVRPYNNNNQQQQFVRSGSQNYNQINYDEDSGFQNNSRGMNYNQDSQQFDDGFDFDPIYEQTPMENYGSNNQNFDGSSNYQRNFRRRPNPRQMQGNFERQNFSDYSPAVYTSVSEQNFSPRFFNKSTPQKMPKKRKNPSMQMNSEQMSTSQSVPDVLSEEMAPLSKKPKCREYIVKMPKSLNLPTLNKPQEKKINVDGQSMMVTSVAAKDYVKCELCNLFFSTAELLEAHKESPRHLTNLKGAIKMHLTTASQLEKELLALITPKENTGPAVVCCLCDKFHTDAKGHKWTVFHQIHVMEGTTNKSGQMEVEEVEKTETEDAPTKDETECRGLKYIITMSGHYCKICKKKVTSKTNHCISKKHLFRVQKVEDFIKLKKAQKAADETEGTEQKSSEETDTSMQE